MSTTELIKRKLATLTPHRVAIVDEAQNHIGHEGSKSGGHFRLVIVSPMFSGKTSLVRHRMVYETLGDLMQTKIHALTINALTPEEDTHRANSGSI